MKYKRMLSVLIVAALLFTCFAAAPAMAKKKAKKKRPVKKVTVYERDYQTGKLVKATKSTFKYKKGYPSRINTYDYGAQKRERSVFKYKFSGKKPKSMKHYVNGQQDMSAKYKYGMPVLVKVWSEDKTDVRTSKYTYYKKRFLKTARLDSVVKSYSADGKSADTEYNRDQCRFKLKIKKGVLRKAVAQGTYSNTLNNEPQNWLTYMNDYISEYDKMGIVKKTSSKIRDKRLLDNFPPESRPDVITPQQRFKVTKKKGLVTKVSVYNWETASGKTKGKWSLTKKVVFKYYKKKKIGKVRYANMINEQLLEQGNNYYRYNWF